MTLSIQPLKKVQLSLQAGSNSANSQLPSAPVYFSFLFGIGRDGFCPFESALCDKCRGDSIRLTLSAAEGPELFGHLFGPLRQVFGVRTLPETMWLQVEVISVADADNREVVKALATAAGQGGCGGSCDCGCS